MNQRGGDLRLPLRILLNAFYKLAQGEKLTGDEMQAIIDRADATKAAKASERLRAASKQKA